MGENIGDPCLLCSVQMSNQGQKFVDRSKIFETFRFLDQCQLSTEKKINICTAILNYTNDEGPSFQTQNVAKRLIF